MSPRPYRLGQRQAAVDQTRARVIAAARELLVGDDPGRFSIEAVAQRADVARATVYYQFRSKLGLLEALFDSAAAAGGMAGLADAFGRPDSLAALDGFIAVFGRFWGSDRRLHQRLYGLAAADPDLGAALAARQEWRRQGITVLVRRLTREHGSPPAERQQDVIDMLFMLTGFAAFDALAGTGATPEAVVPLIRHLARAAAGLPGRTAS